MKTEEPKTQKMNIWGNTPMRNWMEPEKIYQPGQNKNNHSKVLGILSICLFWTGPISVILSGIGRSKYMEGSKPRRDYWLNTIGLLLGMNATVVYIRLFLGI